MGGRFGGAGSIPAASTPSPASADARAADPASPAGPTASADAAAASSLATSSLRLPVAGPGRASLASGGQPQPCQLLPQLLDVKRARSERQAHTSTGACVSIRVGGGADRGGAASAEKLQRLAGGGGALAQRAYWRALALR